MRARGFLAALALSSSLATAAHAQNTQQAFADDVPLPVPYTQINAILFQANGQILVRSADRDTTTLTLLNPDRTINTQVTEPALTGGDCPQNLNRCALLAYVP